MKFKDRKGRVVECTAIYNKGQVGQAVILDQVTFGPGHALNGYSHPSAFTITEIAEDSYFLRDGCGVSVVVQHKDGSFLYPANQWLAWKKAQTDDVAAASAEYVERLTDRLKTLTEILTKQGFRVVTEEQAEKLGIA